MRRHRPFRHLPTVLAVAIGMAAVPSAAAAAPGEGSPAEPTPGPELLDLPRPTPGTTTTGAPAPAPPSPDVFALPPRTPPAVVVAKAPAPSEPPPAAGGAHGDDDELDIDATAVLPDGPTRSIAFPVLGAVRYANDWGNCRDGCTRRHQGTDVIGVRMQPLVAAVDGTVTRVRYENVGTAGAVVTITDGEGWRYNYFHVNNDTPGSDDGAAAPEWRIRPGLSVGSAVRAGDVIAFMGDSGNAEGSVPHLHFEIRQPDGTPVNPYHSLVGAQRRRSCAVDMLPREAEPGPGPSDAIAIIPLDGGGRWLIESDGGIVAEGSAGWIGSAGDPGCDVTDPPAASGDAGDAAPDSVVAAPDAAVADRPDAQAPPDPHSAPDAPADAPEPDLAAAAPSNRWPVERGQSLWTIVQSAYGTRDAAGTIALVDVVFDHNRHQLADPDVLEIGITLELPPPAA